ncbi:SDR family oxidoreductase [Candidatus Bathyarchaeota archaeon]|nr:MAG: SDR family oxidoreductase [Candidatus Bathyarchaeota archaeon]
MHDMKGKLCIITGANSGIGYHTTKALAAMKATIIMACRDLEKGQKALDSIKEATGSNSLYLMHIDTSSMKSIDRFTREFTDRFTCLNVLINNAGAAFSKRQTTEEGYEKTIATNYLGPFKLTHNLLPMLRQKTPSRIINISSGMHKTGKVDFDDLMIEKHYKSMQAYATSKLMVTAYTYALAERIQGTGVTANVVEPGFVATNLGANMGGFWDKLSFKLVRPMQITAEQGAETSIWAASDPELETVTGKTFAKKAETETAEITHSKEFQDKLWDTTTKLLAL